MDEKSYTLHIDPAPKRRPGQHKEGYHAWNKGKTWEEQGWTEERKQKVIAQLRINMQNNRYTKMRPRKNPVIQMDENENRLHWYESSEAAARKLGVNGRNIRSVCDGQRKHCGGYRWKWDERFLT